MTTQAGTGGDTWFCPLKQQRAAIKGHIRQQNKLIRGLVARKVFSVVIGQRQVYGGALTCLLKIHKNEGTSWICKEPEEAVLL